MSRRRGDDAAFLRAFALANALGAAALLAISLPYFFPSPPICMALALTAFAAALAARCA